jgi:hypothetical protein
MTLRRDTNFGEIRDSVRRELPRSKWMPRNEILLSIRFSKKKINYGPGAKVSGRVPWSDQISKLKIERYSVEGCMQGKEWLPSTDSTQITSLF